MMRFQSLSTALNRLRLLAEMKLPKHRRTALLAASILLGLASWALPFVLMFGIKQAQQALLELYTGADFGGAYFLGPHIYAICLLASGLLFGILDSWRGTVWATATSIPLVVGYTSFWVINLLRGIRWEGYTLYWLIIVAVFTICVANVGALLGAIVRKILERQQI